MAREGWGGGGDAKCAGFGGKGSVCGCPSTWKKYGNGKEQSALCHVHATSLGKFTMTVLFQRRTFARNDSPFPCNN